MITVLQRLLAKDIDQASRKSLSISESREIFRELETRLRRLEAEVENIRRRINAP